MPLSGQRIPQDTNIQCLFINIHTSSTIHKSMLKEQYFQKQIPQNVIKKKNNNCFVMASVSAHIGCYFGV